MNNDTVIVVAYYLSISVGFLLLQILVAGKTSNSLDWFDTRGDIGGLGGRGVGGGGGYRTEY